MLIEREPITRKPSEKILIGDDIIITVRSVDRGQVRLGIECPRDVIVLRAEIAGQPLRPGSAGERRAAKGRA